MSITNNVARAKTDYDDVYEAGKASVYESITITSDIANAVEFFNLITPLLSENDKVVMFMRKDFNGAPPADAPRGLGLWFMWQSTEYGASYRQNVFMRWIDGEYSPSISTVDTYIFVVSAGTEFVKVVLRLFFSRKIAR